ncbi:MAG: hypothetical protein V1888_01635 [archaeon]
MPELEAPIKKEYDYSAQTNTKPKSLIPEQFMPTKKLGTIFGAIILLVIFLSLLQLPLDSFLSGDINVKIGIGIPYAFLEFDLSNTSTFPLKISGLIFDLLIYLVLAYAIDISLTLILRNGETEEDKAKQPLVFKDQQTTIADKITKKVFEKAEVKQPNPQNPIKPVA